MNESWCTSLQRKELIDAVQVGMCQLDPVESDDWSTVEDEVRLAKDVWSILTKPIEDQSLADDGLHPTHREVCLMLPPPPPQ